MQRQQQATMMVQPQAMYSTAMSMMKSRLVTLFVCEILLFIAVPSGYQDPFSQQQPPQQMAQSPQMYGAMYGTPTGAAWPYPVYAPAPNANAGVGMIGGRDGRGSPIPFNVQRGTNTTNAPTDANGGNMAQLQAGYLFSPVCWDQSSGQIVQIGSPQQVCSWMTG